jgi:hypothetical protein
MNKEINEYNEIFLGRQTRQAVKGLQIHPHLQGGDVASP